MESVFPNYSELSPSMRYMTRQAAAEQEGSRSEKIAVEHMFLSLLRLAELDEPEAAVAFGTLTTDRQEIAASCEDVRALRESFALENIDTARTRDLLRELMPSGATDDPKRINAYFALAKAFAMERGEDCIWAQDILKAILRSPTDAIVQVCPLGSDDGSAGTVSEKAPGNLSEMSRDFLLDLTNRIREMRKQLLLNVFGQDHVVHAFAEGIFAAEVLAASDEKRVRPRAVFVFAGPPGVGKTFLAVQAAQQLKIPYKRYDMSGFAGHHSHESLIGHIKTYAESSPGTLTDFVRQNPHSILLFDEIEKAGMETINLFLQILDAGNLHDEYLNENVSFKDTIIIFTTNACKSLYDEGARDNAAGIPRQTILNALATELNPQTGEPFFPPAITSRMGTGWPILFNHLRAHHLEKISRKELSRCCGMFERQYGIRVGYDPLVPTALLFRESSFADARNLRAQSEMFFKNEIFKVFKLWGEESLQTAMKHIRSIHFSIEPEKLPSDVRELFQSDEKPEILLYSDDGFADRCREKLPQYVFHHVQKNRDAMDILGEKDIRLALIDLTLQESGLFPTDFAGDSFLPAFGKDEGAFDYAPMSADAIRDGTVLFRDIREYMPELPVYLLETEGFRIDAELEMSFVRAGARGKLTEPKLHYDNAFAPDDRGGDFTIFADSAGEFSREENFTVFEDKLEKICRELYAQSVATRMGNERKILYFETAPKLTDDKTEIEIGIRDFTIKRAVAADDMSSILDDVDRPKERFSDVIGAEEAKKTLRAYIDHLKDPKKYKTKGDAIPKSALLYGPSGTGKTMLARAMAGESNVTFLQCTATDFVTEFTGSGPKAVRMLFRRARRYAPSVVLIDEVDAIGRKRGQSGYGHAEEMTLEALFTEMDSSSADTKHPVFVVATTNYDIEEGKGGPGVIDAAFSRRFDRLLYIGLPNADEREQMIRVGLKRNHNVSEAKIKSLAQRSFGMSHAAIAKLIGDAYDAMDGNTLWNAGLLADEELESCFEQLRYGARKDWSYEHLERVARHEAGHALLSCLSGNEPAYLTIVSRGDQGGYMEHQITEDEPLFTREQLLDRIRTLLGGRAAEMLYYHDGGISTGAAGDLKQASRLAYSMVCVYGMDPESGLYCVEEDRMTNELRARINEILNEELQNAVSLLRNEMGRLDTLARELIRKNKLTGEEIAMIVGRRPQGGYGIL